jgi:hypothetical protein
MISVYSLGDFLSAETRIDILSYIQSAYLLLNCSCWVAGQITNLVQLGTVKTINFCS